LNFAPLHDHKSVNFTLGVYSLLFQKLVFLHVSHFQLLPYEQFALKILLFRFSPVGNELLFGPTLFLLVLIDFLLLGHKDLEPLFFYFLLGLYSLLHLLNVGCLLQLFHLQLLHKLDVVFVLQNFNIPRFFAGFFNFFPGSGHLILKHAHSVAEKLAVLLDLLPDGSGLWIC
jgi:hypothetical protein